MAALAAENEALSRQMMDAHANYIASLPPEFLAWVRGDDIDHLEVN
jgi:hypothetical protein